jgi:hypothetical protein
MTALEKRAQKISWAVGQIMCDRDVSEEEEWQLKLLAAKIVDEKDGEPER